MKFNISKSRRNKRKRSQKGIVFFPFFTVNIVFWGCREKVSLFFFSSWLQICIYFLCWEELMWMEYEFGKNEESRIGLWLLCVICMENRKLFKIGKSYFIIIPYICTHTPGNKIVCPLIQDELMGDILNEAKGITVTLRNEELLDKSSLFCFLYFMYRKI